MPRLPVRRVGLLCAGAILSGCFEAPSYQWQALPVGAGGWIMHWDADETGRTRIVHTDTYGAYVWDEAQDRWVQMVTSASMPERFQDSDGGEGAEWAAVAPSDPDRIYLAYRGSVLRSDDAGRSFTETALRGRVMRPNDEYRQSGPVLSVSPRDPDLVVMGLAEEALQVSRDGGASWQPAGLPLPVDTEAADGVQGVGTLAWFASDGALWALPYGRGMHVSRDGGRSFARLPGGPDYLDTGDFAPGGAFFGASYKETAPSLWRYTDGAWTDLTARAGLSEISPTAVAVEPRSGEVWVLSDGGLIARSRDGGERWQRLDRDVVSAPGEPRWLENTQDAYLTTAQIGFDPVVPGRLWLSAGDGVYYADTAGATDRITFVSSSRGIEQLVANDTVAPPGGAPVLGGWDFGLRVKDDLTALSDDFGPTNRFNSVWDIDYSAGTPSFLAAVVSDHRFCCTQDGLADQSGYSLDGGRSWTRFEARPVPAGTEPSDPYAMSFGSLAVASGDTRNIVWVPAFDRQPHVTFDRGGSWRPITLPGVAPAETGAHFALFLDREVVAADRAAPSTFYYYRDRFGDDAGDGLYASEDGGRSWQRRFAGAITENAQFNAKLAAVPGREGNLYFTTGALDGRDAPFFVSRDGGASWSEVAGLSRVLAFGFGAPSPMAEEPVPTIFVAGKLDGAYGIYRSTDDAATWKLIGRWPAGTLDEVESIAGDSRVFGRVFVGLNGSGWVQGTPSFCEGAPFAFGDRAECFAVPGNELSDELREDIARLGRR